MTLFRRLTALFLLMAYVMAVLGGSAHFEHHHQHRPPVLAEKAEESANHHGCTCHHHAHIQPNSDACDAECEDHNGDPPCPHDHDHGGCPICQTLADKPMPAVVVAIVVTSEPVVDRPEDPAISPDASPATQPVSRGPPVQG